MATPAASTEPTVGLAAGALAAAARRPLLALPLYLANLLVALAPAAMVGLGFSQLAGDRPWSTLLLGGDWANQGIELGIAAGASAQLGGDTAARVASAGTSLGLAVALAGVGVLVQGLVYNLLAGGIIERLRAAIRPSIPPDMPFWAACRHWFWPFLRLGVLGGLAFALLGLVGVIVLIVIGSAIGPTVTLVLVLAWLFLLNGWLELARASMVTHADPSAWRAILRASRLLATTRLPSILALWLILGLAGLALLAIHGFALTTLDPLMILIAVGVGQALSFLGAWLKVARLASALALAEAPPEARA